VVRGDLNDEFASMFAERFDLITAIEVIEHLENPSCFLRECRMLLADGGKLIITTPNFESAAGRLRFLVTGELRQFGRDTRFNDPTHIAPVHSFVFERIVRHAGLRVVERSSYDARVTSRATTRFAAAVLRPIMKDVKAGDNHVFVLETG
jgi:2-polyprenyl-3-methyl-5-hydroxy-6-metoxy-1,4-benzoquinol methylase